MLTSDILQSELNDPKLNSEVKISTHMQFLTQKVPNFYPFHSTISHFEDIAHFRIFHR